jgi:hypothetical protein
MPSTICAPDSRSRRPIHSHAVMGCDRAMLGAAGPGLAHHAKPSVKAVGPLVDHADLTALLYVQVMRSPISSCPELDLAGRLPRSLTPALSRE